MGKTMVSAGAFPEIVECYNKEGRQAAYEMIQSRYGIKQPIHVIKRIQKSGAYSYDGAADRFRSSGDGEDNGLFMGLDELCGTLADGPQGIQTPAADDRPAAMERLVNELINDRLLTLSRYITMDTLTRTVLIDGTSLTADGYRVVSH